MLKLASSVLAVAALLTGATPAAAQSVVGDADHLQAAHATCLAATQNPQMDRDVILARGWQRAQPSVEGGPEVYLHARNPSLVAITPQGTTCAAMTLIADETVFENYLARFASNNPQKNQRGAYMFCSSQRVTGLQMDRREQGLVVSAYYTVRTGTDRCAGT